MSAKRRCRSWCKMADGDHHVTCEKRDGHSGQHEGRWSKAYIRVWWPKRRHTPRTGYRPEKARY